MAASAIDYCDAVAEYLRDALHLASVGTLKSLAELRTGGPGSPAAPWVRAFATNAADAAARARDACAGIDREALVGIEHRLRRLAGTEACVIRTAATIATLVARRLRGEPSPERSHAQLRELISQL